ncbi:MAG TPA: hypothetical protein VE155_12740 [Pseudonocardiaceae bacterium]|nr:hypothetical protein [Pseudonocardiaceae bacterium]
MIEIAEARAGNPNLITVRRSRMSEPIPLRPLLHPPRYIPRPGTKITGDMLELPYAAEAAASYPILKRMIEKYSLRDIPPQYGIPDPLNLAGFSWLNPLRHYDADADAALREVNSIWEITDGHVLYQLEIPCQTYAVAKAPRRYQSAVARHLAQRIAQFIERTPVGSAWTVHLCVGNKNDEPLIDLENTEPLVTLVNELAYYWPTTQELTSMSLPFGSRIRPVPLTADYYAALSDLHLPPGIQLTAGLVRGDIAPHAPNWGDWVDHHLRARDRIERVADRGLWKISTPCGWSRAPATLEATMQLLVTLADTA